MSLKDYLIGKPLKTGASKEEKITKTKALAILSADAISSVAFATEGILVVLSSRYFNYVIPISLLILFLAGTLVLSYSQVIRAYPDGGGSYTVARDVFKRETVSLLAVSALSVDYILTVAVGVAAGGAALTSAFPHLVPFTVLLDLLMILSLMLVNLRGSRESASAFMFPSYLFMAVIVILGIAGIFAHPTSTAPSYQSSSLLFPAVPLLLLLRAFSSGATALTGIEAISNSVSSFKFPAQPNAIKTMAAMGLVLATLFSIVTYLAVKFHTLPVTNQTVLSQLGHVVFRGGLLYYILQFATSLILVMSANTAFVGFSNLGGLVAEDGYLPRYFGIKGDRLVYSNGIIALSIAASLLVIFFRGNTISLLPLYAIGVFISFTIAQSGMVKRWVREKKYGPALINGFGAILTTVVFGIMAVSKFLAGSWMVLVFIPLMIAALAKIHRHYASLKVALRIADDDLNQSDVTPYSTMVIVPISSLNKASLHSLSYARGLTNKVVALSIVFTEEDKLKLMARWAKLGIPEEEMRLEVIVSQFRSAIKPIIRFVNGEASLHRDKVTVIIPEFISDKWWHQFLHNKTALLLTYRLRGRNIAIVDLPFHLSQVE